MRSTRRGKINVNLISFATILVMVAWVLLFIPNASGEDKEKDKYKKGELIIKFKPDVPEDIKDKIHIKYDSKKIKIYSSFNIDYVKLKDTLGVEEAIALYLENPEVEFAEPNFLYSAVTSPNDPYFNHLWGFNNSGQNGGTPGADIDILRAWGMTTGDSDIAVSIIDTGIDYNHPDLSENIWVNLAESSGTTGVDDDGNGYVDDVYGIDTYGNDTNPTDDHGHGTHVAGTVGAVGNNGIGVPGVNWQIKLIPCKFLNRDGYGYTDGALECLEYVRALKERGVNIVATNNSWGGDSYSQALYEAIDAQRRSGILFIAAAGNDNANNDEWNFYPASYNLPNVLSVAAVDPNDSKAWFSNFGRRTVHVGAPGVNIVSLRANGTDMYGDGQHFIPQGDPDAEYYVASGTSMAAPHVTGLVGLIKSQNPAKTWIDVKNLIISGSDNMDFYGSTIAGRINAYRSLTCNQSPVFSVLEFPDSFQAGMSTTLSALSINCETPLGPVVVTSSSGDEVYLYDNGTSPDLVANDGIFSASWMPANEFSYLTFSSPAGTETVPNPSILTASLPSGLVNKSYSQVLQVSNGVPPYVWSVLSGTLPQGLTLNETTGVISGIPSTTGVWSFLVKVVDSKNSFDMRAFSMTIGEIDLIVTSVSGPSSGIIGQSIAVTTKVKNQGDSDSGVFYASIYLSTDSIVDTTDRALTTFSADVPAGTEQTYTKNVTLPLALVPGVYYLGTIVDAGNRVAESNENNNSGVGNQIEVASDVDLVTTSVSGPFGGSPGQPISISIGIRNRGSIGAGEHWVDAYFSVDSTITKDDIRLGSVYVNNLGPGVEQTVTLNTAIPSGLNGSYYIGAITDSRSDVVESNENNNSLAGNQISVGAGLPDLSATSVSGPASGNPGQQIQTTVVVTNQGTANSGGFNVGVYLSLDAAITTGDTLVGSGSVSSLAVGGQQTLTVSGTIPSSLTPGTYFLGAIVDSGNSVSESNENNNSVAGNQTSVASAMPDLVATSVLGPASGSPGEQIQITVDVKNQGTGSSGGFNVSVYLSLDATVTTNDTQVGSYYVSSLAAGEQKGVTINDTIPSTLAPGPYYLGAIVDSGYSVPESNEDNNSVAGNQISIGVGLPDLMATSVSGPGNGSQGERIQLTVVIKNQGTTSSGGFEVSVYLSTDQTITSRDTKIGTISLSGLEGNAEQTVTINGKVHPKLPSGDYFVGVVVDSGNKVTESDEDNNVLAVDLITISK
jgi:subtilase family serine protease/subtilisin family serine protease